MKAPNEIIRELREDSDEMQKEVAHAINMTQQQYSKYENGTHEWPLRYLAPVADHFNVTSDYILSRTKSRVGIDALNASITPEYTSGELLSDVLSLNQEGREEVVKFIRYQKTK